MPAENEKLHISFSEIRVFENCPWKWMLTYQQGYREGDNAWSVFGNCLHKAIDENKKGNKVSWIGFGKNWFKWINKTEKEILLLDDKNPNKISFQKAFEKQNKFEWLNAGFNILKYVYDWLEINFPQYELIDTEYKIYEKIDGFDLNFKGFIDLVLKTPDGQYHIIDFKTTSWGWDKEEKNDTVKLYQIVLYKKYFAKAYNIDFDKISCHYVLLKRTPSAKEKNSPIELFSISSGPTKIDNANAWLTTNVKALKRGLKLKIRSSCTYCMFKDRKDLCP